MLIKLLEKYPQNEFFKVVKTKVINWFIEREHLNKPSEIFEELQHFFDIDQIEHFPFKYIPFIHMNLCIGINLSPK